MDTGFVDAVRPRLIVSTGARFPASERPDENWISLVEGRGIRVFRQDVTGAVRIDLRPTAFQAAGFFDGSRYSSPTK